MIGWVAALLGLIALGGCEDDCRSYSKFTCAQIQRATYNVHFSFPNDANRTYHLGQVQGLSACGARARAYAAEKGVQQSRWGYVCCMVAEGSSCLEKHR